MDILVDWVCEFKYIVCMGCIYGIYVELIIFGLKLVCWYLEMKWNQECFEYVVKGVEVGKIFGVVGIFVEVDL